MSLTTKQEHVTTTVHVHCAYQNDTNNVDFTLPRLDLEFSPPRLGLELSASALPRLRTLLPCLASASTSMPWPLPLPRQNCIEPIPDTYYEC